MLLPNHIVIDFHSLSKFFGEFKVPLSNPSSLELTHILPSYKIRIQSNNVPEMYSFTHTNLFLVTKYIVSFPAPLQFERIAMLACGTGIAPMVQVIR